MSLFDESIHGLRARVHSFQVDIKTWVKRADDGDLTLHREQLTRLSDFLGGTMSEVIAGKPIDPRTQPPFSGTVDDIPGLRRRIGSVHLMWEFFRDKLAQRDVSTFTNHLGAADDFAWACYEPFLIAATTAVNRKFEADQVKAPPLVFYSTDRTPFAQARTRTLHPNGLDSKDLKFFGDALQRLPVPVIGTPWEVANRMPEATLIGHEAAHVIAEDLGLADEARRALTAAPFTGDDQGQRRTVWLAWCDEVFADVIGVLASGSAFLEGLESELAGSKDDVRLAPIKPATPGNYPTSMLRVALCGRVLRRIGVTPSTAWTDAYGPVVADSADYLDDLDVVAAALLDRAWDAVGGQRLDQILTWDAARENEALSVGTKELKEQPATVPFDVRTWVAASMHAYRSDPDRYTKLDLDKKFAEFIVSQRQVSVRSSRTVRDPLLPLAFGDEDLLGAREERIEETLAVADRQAGADLAREFLLA